MKAVDAASLAQALTDEAEYLEGDFEHAETAQVLGASYRRLAAALDPQEEP